MLGGLLGGGGGEGGIAACRFPFLVLISEPTEFQKTYYAIYKAEANAFQFYSTLSGRFNVK